MLLRTVNPGKPSINGPFSMAMLNNQRVTQHMLYIYIHIELMDTWDTWDTWQKKRSC